MKHSVKVLFAAIVSILIVGAVIINEHESSIVEQVATEHFEHLYMSTGLYSSYVSIVDDAESIKSFQETIAHVKYEETESFKLKDIENIVDIPSVTLVVDEHVVSLSFYDQHLMKVNVDLEQAYYFEIKWSEALETALQKLYD